MIVLNIPHAYIEYLYFFHIKRDYFECHEVLEDYWKENGMKRDAVWVLLIQIAVGLYHYRRENLKGALKMLRKAEMNFPQNRFYLQLLGIDHTELFVRLQTLIKQVQAQHPYTSIDLPITDEHVVNLCQSYANKHDDVWLSNTTPVSSYIIHKHKLRDRSDVLNERLQSLSLRKERQYIHI